MDDGKGILTAMGKRSGILERTGSKKEKCEEKYAVGTGGTVWREGGREERGQ